MNSASREACSFLLLQFNFFRELFGYLSSPLLSCRARTRGQFCAPATQGRESSPELCPWSTDSGPAFSAPGLRGVRGVPLCPGRLHLDLDEVGRSGLKRSASCFRRVVRLPGLLGSSRPPRLVRFCGPGGGAFPLFPRERLAERLGEARAARTVSSRGGGNRFYLCSDGAS